MLRAGALQFPGAAAMHVGHSKRRRGAGVAVALAATLLLAGWGEDASASTTAAGGLATSLGMLAALIALLAIKGWTAHAAAGSIGSAGGMLALGAGALLVWRATRRVVPARSWIAAHVDAARAFLARRSTGVSTWPAAALPGIDRVSFERELAAHFTRLQLAWDRGDFCALGALTTPLMLSELRDNREAYGGPAVCSDVRTLRALVLGHERSADGEVVCVEFTGTMREKPASGDLPFREVWMLVRSDADPAWRLARQQTLI